MSVPPSRPTSEEVVAALGQVYGVAGPGDVQPHPYQRGGTGRGGRALQVDQVSLWFKLSAGDAEVTTSLRPEPGPAFVVSTLLLRKLARRVPRLPVKLVVVRSKLAVAVDGRRETFAVYTFGGRASLSVAWAVTSSRFTVRPPSCAVFS